MFKNILVAIDITDKTSSAELMKVAIEYRVMCPAAKITFLHVVQSFVNLIDDFFPKEWLNSVQQKSLDSLESTVGSHFKGDKLVSCCAEQGVIYERINEKSEQLNADLIIIGAQTADRYDYRLGPNAASVVRYSKVSVLVVR